MNYPGQISLRLKYRRLSKSCVGLLIVWLGVNALIATEFGSFAAEPMSGETIEVANLNMNITDCNLDIANMRADLEN